MPDQDLLIEEQAYKTAVEAAIAASKLVLQYWPNMSNPYFNKTLSNDLYDKEGAGNYATIADKESEKTIIRFIQAQELLKDHSILSEEQDEIKGNSQWQWVIDPIDGTQPFKNGLEEYGISIGVVKDKEPIIGIISLPAKNQLIVARKDNGVMVHDLDGQFIQKLERKPEDEHMAFDKILVGFDVGYTDRDKHLETVKKIITKVGYCVSYASCSAANFFLAKGYLGGYFITTPTQFDIAAAAVIMGELGIVSDIQGNPIDWTASSRTYLAARSKEIHRQLVTLLNQ